MGIQVASVNVVGRDRLIELIWRRLEKDSLVFTAERRIGKTTVMKKLEHEPRPGFQVFYVDLEKIDSAHGFTEELLTRLKSLLSKSQIASGWLNSFLKQFGGTEIGGIIKIPEPDHSRWQSILEKTFEGICNTATEGKIVLLLDELPYMLQKIEYSEQRANVHHNSALQLMDTLREMRHRHQNLRMVFAGSVGLHHVLADLQKQKLASQPDNDMPSIPIEPLELEDACQLARRLLHDEQVDLHASADDVAKALAELTDRVPFYLERTIKRLSEQSGPVTVILAQQLIQKQLTDDNNDWEMEHFRSRLNIYYPGNIKDVNAKIIDRSKVARMILDLLAVAPTPISIDQVWTGIKAQLAIEDRELIVELLRLMSLDHYLASDSNKCYSFRFPLVRRWWVLAQGLTP